MILEAVQFIDDIYDNIHELMWYNVSRVHSSHNFGTNDGLNAWYINLNTLHIRAAFILSNTDINYIEHHTELTGDLNDKGTYDIFNKNVKQYIMARSYYSVYIPRIKEILYAMEDQTKTQIDSELFDLLDDILENSYNL